MRKAICLLSLASSPLLLDGQEESDSRRHAICILYPKASPVRGLVSFSQNSPQAPVKIACSVKGLNPNGKHGLHIYEFGDLTGHSGAEHFNPERAKHGSPFGEDRHAGDLGNLQADPFGNAYMCLALASLTLFGEGSILGRGVGVHAREDDLGRSGNPESARDGNSGEALAGGVVGLSREFKTVPPFAE